MAFLVLSCARPMFQTGRILRFAEVVSRYGLKRGPLCFLGVVYTATGVLAQVFDASMGPILVFGLIAVPAAFAFCFKLVPS